MTKIVTIADHSLPHILYFLAGSPFLRRCASCQGDDGKGHGPATVAPKNQPADLTQISKKMVALFPARTSCGLLTASVRCQPMAHDICRCGEKYSAKNEPIVRPECVSSPSLHLSSQSKRSRVAANSPIHCGLPGDKTNSHRRFIVVRLRRTHRWLVGTQRETSSRMSIIFSFTLRNLSFISFSHVSSGFTRSVLPARRNPRQ